MFLKAIFDKNWRFFFKKSIFSKKTAFCLAFFDQKVKMTKSEKVQNRWQA